MSTPDNTLLGRCTVAYVEGFNGELTSSISQPQARRTGVASVLDQLKPSYFNCAVKNLTNVQATKQKTLLEVTA